MSDTWPPHLTVACIVEDNNRFLMVEEMSHGRLVYNQPAGHLDPGETMLDAAIRETYEETGWHVQPTHILGMARYTAPQTGTVYYRTTYIAKPLRLDENAKLDEGIVRAVWLTYEELKAQPEKLRSRLVLRNIEQYLAGFRFPLSLIDDNEQ